MFIQSEGGYAVNCRFIKRFDFTKRSGVENSDQFVMAYDDDGRSCPISNVETVEDAKQYIADLVERINNHDNRTD